MADRVCKWCEFLKALKDKDLEEELKQYINHIPEEIKVSEEIYLKRLEQCNKCQSYSQGICRFCGCYVAARAVKKEMYCPSPTGKKWNKCGGD